MAENLTKNGVKIIIALGHSGYEKDQEIARNCPLVDVVVGGHSHSFLYTGTPPPESEDVAGPYPTVVEQQSGKKVPVVQAFKFSKYIGKLELSVRSLSCPSSIARSFFLILKISELKWRTSLF